MAPINANVEFQKELFKMNQQNFTQTQKDALQYKIAQDEKKASKIEAEAKALSDAKIESFSMPVHRKEDDATDLFTVMNVIQENLIRGGARVLVEQDGKRKDMAIRRVNSLITQTEINTMLWDLAEQKVA
jgi:hypothetical protein